tara:strand:- start:10 stop:456 length:447 start_codon:yes stop_codon:yes gene_type:complete
MQQTKTLINLYSDKILKLAADISLYDRLDEPDITIKKRAPICGSMVIVDLNISNNIITGYAHDIRACALGQASASILSKEIVGRKSSEIIETRMSVKEMLVGGSYQLDKFHDYKFLSPAADYKNRHASIMLVLDAAVEGILKIEENQV